jgi:hypothetical protein
MRRLALLLLAAACAPRPPPPGAAGPVEAAQDFALALQKGDAAAAWSLLSSRAQREADALAARARAFAGDAGVGPESGRQMLFTSALPQGKVQVRKVAQTTDGEATVEVTDTAGAKRVYPLLREGGSWKLDLDLSSGSGQK